MLKIIDNLIYLAGVSFLATLAHELYHFAFCGGGFIAGLYYLNQTLGFGVTYCTGNSTGELIPNIIFLLVVAILMYPKIKRLN